MEMIKLKIPLLGYIFLLLLSFSIVFGNNITSAVFGRDTNFLPAAFGDFNSDELIDLFVLKNNAHSVEVLLASDQDPLMQHTKLKCFFNESTITSIVPGDFDGDAHLDILVTTNKGSNEEKTDVYVLWGGGSKLTCSDKPLVEMIGQPLALDYNNDMITDIFGVSVDRIRTFWVFNENRSPPINFTLHSNDRKKQLKMSHSHAFFDVNEDDFPDLILTTESDYEIWLKEENGFSFNYSIPNPTAKIIGQSVFIDFELEGVLNHVVPVCFDAKCLNSSLLVYKNKKWNNLNPFLKDPLGNLWGFAFPNPDVSVYLKAITVRSGDFNMDGYPDLLATLAFNSQTKAFLLENVPCEAKTSCGGLSRTYSIGKNYLNSMNQGTVMATFYDFYQDGTLDIILATSSAVQAYRNNLDYDANFVKVMVVGTERGMNLPGPQISYSTVSQEGNQRVAVMAQLPQSAHFSLGLPYSIFGLDRTPNFVDKLRVGVGGYSKEWTQIIPNSQMVVVIPWPNKSPSTWRAKLFVTPSKLILMSVAALTGTCGLIVLIISVLYLKERREDRIEKLQEAHRFHFDAM